MQFRKFLAFFIITTLLFSVKASFLDEYSPTVQAYEAICGEREHSLQSIDPKILRDMCNVVLESDLCKDVKPIHRRNCEKPELDSSNPAMMIAECLAGVGEAMFELWDLVKLLWNLVFDEQVRDQMSEEATAFIDSTSVYYETEYQKAKDEYSFFAEERASAKAKAKTMQHLFNKIIVEPLKGSFNKIACHDPEGAANHVCQSIWSVIFPPAGIIAAVKHGPKVAAKLIKEAKESGRSLAVVTREYKEKRRAEKEDAELARQREQDLERENSEYLDLEMKRVQYADRVEDLNFIPEKKPNASGLHDSDAFRLKRAPDRLNERKRNADEINLLESQIAKTIPQKNGNKLIVFENGTRALWRPRLEKGPVSHNADVLAYEIDNLLGIGLVPSTVFKKVDGKVGSLQRMRNHEFDGKLKVAHAKKRDLDTQEFFDFLIDNRGRKTDVGEGYLVTKSGKVISSNNGLSFTGNGKSFKSFPSVADNIQRFMLTKKGQQVMNKIKNINPENLADQMRKYIGVNDSVNFSKRAKFLIDYYDKLYKIGQGNAVRVAKEVILPDADVPVPTRKTIKQANKPKIVPRAKDPMDSVITLERSQQAPSLKKAKVFADQPVAKPAVKEAPSSKPSGALSYFKELKNSALRKLDPRNDKQIAQAKHYDELVKNDGQGLAKLDETKIESIESVSKSKMRSDLADLSSGTLDGQRVFFKSHHRHSDLVDEAAMYELVTNSGIRTPYMGTVKLPDGNMAIASEYVEGGLLQSVVGGYKFFTRGQGKFTEYKIGQHTIDALEDMKKKLRQAEIEPGDFQVLLKKDGTPVLFDVGSYRLSKPGGNTYDPYKGITELQKKLRNEIESRAGPAKNASETLKQSRPRARQQVDASETVKQPKARARQQVDASETVEQPRPRNIPSAPKVRSKIEPNLRYKGGVLIRNQEIPSSYNRFEKLEEGNALAVNRMPYRDTAKSYNGVVFYDVKPEFATNPYSHLPVSQLNQGIVKDLSLRPQSKKDVEINLRRGQVVKTEVIKENKSDGSSLASDEARGSKTDSYKVTVKNENGERIQGVFKPREDSALSNYTAEVVAYQIDDLLGLGLVPPTIARTMKINGKEVMGSFQHYKENVGSLSELLRGKHDVRPVIQDIQKQNFLDFLIDNRDRHNNNWLIDKNGRAISIDNSLSFTGNGGAYFNLEDRIGNIDTFLKTLEGRRAIERLRSVNKDQLKVEMVDNLGKVDGERFMERVDFLLKYFDRNIRETPVQKPDTSRFKPYR